MVSVDVGLPTHTYQDDNLQNDKLDGNFAQWLGSFSPQEVDH